MDDSTVPASASTCPGGGTEIAPALLSCPACKRLVHAEALKRLATYVLLVVALSALSMIHVPPAAA